MIARSQAYRLYQKITAWRLPDLSHLERSRKEAETMGYRNQIVEVKSRIHNLKIEWYELYKSNEDPAVLARQSEAIAKQEQRLQRLVGLVQRGEMEVAKMLCS